MKPSPQNSNASLRPSLTTSCSLLLFWLHPSPPAIQKPWHWVRTQEKDGMKGIGELFMYEYVHMCFGWVRGEFRERKWFSCTYRERQGSVGRRRSVREGYSLKVWSKSHWARTVTYKGTLSDEELPVDLSVYKGLGGLFVDFLNVFVHIVKIDSVLFEIFC